MGKGDKKSKKGKRFKHSFGKTRKRKKGRTISSRKKVVEKPKPVEHKKPAKLEPEIVKPVVIVEPKVEDIAIKEPVISEIKEEVKPTEVIETSVTEIPEIIPEPVKEEVKLPEIKEEAAKEEIVKEEPVKVEAPTEAVPKKRGRPKKKKEE
jgi:ribosomal small subunit protein bTHX